MVTALGKSLVSLNGTRDRLWLLALGFCVAVAISMWTVLANQISYERQQAINQRLRENDNLGLAFEVHVRRILAAATFALKDIEDEYKRHGASMDLAQYLRDRREELSPFSVLSVVDGNGNLVLASVPFIQPQNFRDAENMQFHMRNTTLHTFIAKPRPGAVTGKSTIFVTRRMNKADGSFNGYSSVGLDPDYLTRFYDRFDLGSGSIVTLIGLDGVIRSSNTGEIAHALISSQDAFSMPLMKLLRQGEQGQFRWTHPTLGAIYHFSHRAVGEYPLVALVGVPETVILAQFAQRRRQYLWWTGIATGLVVAFGILLSLLLRRQAQATQALRVSEELVREEAKRADAYLQAAPDPVLIVNQEGKIVLVNHQTENIFGYSKSELVAQPVEKLLPERAVSAHIDFRRSFIEKPSVRQMRPEREVFARRKDGSEFPAEISLSAVDTIDGTYIIGQVRDTTERNRAQDALKRSEKILNEAQRIAQIGNWELDLSHNTLVWSNESYRIFEIEPEAFRASYEAFLAAVHPDDRQSVDKAYRDSITNKVPFDLVHRLLMSDGRVKFVHERCETHFDENGQPTHSVGTVQDITERKKSEDALRENFDLLHRIFSTTHFCVVYLDSGFNFIRVNRAFADAWGHRQDFFPGRNYFALYPDDDTRRIFSEVIETGRSYTTHGGTFAHPNGTEPAKYWDWTLQPVRHAGGVVEGLLFTLVNVTAREHAEQLARNAGRRLQIAVRAAKIGFWDREIATGCVYYSPEWKHQLGYRENEFEDHYDAWRSRVHPDDVERIVSRLDGYLNGQFRDYVVEYRLRHKDGSYRWLYSCGEIVRDSAHMQQRLVGCQVDITDFKLTQQELEYRVAQAELLNALTRAVNEANSLEGAMAACVAQLCSAGNWAIGRIGFLRAAAPLNYPESSVWHATNRIRYEAFIQQSEQAAQHTFEFNGALISVIFRSKRPVWLPDLRHEERFKRRTVAPAHGLHAAFGFPIIVEGKVIAFMEFFADMPRPIDESQMEASETLIGAQLARLIVQCRAIQSNALLASISTSTNDAIFCRDLKGRFVFWNLAAERLYGWKESEVLGLTINHVMPPEQHPWRLPFRELLKRGDTPNPVERVHTTRNGRRLPVQVTLSLLKDNTGAIYGISSIVRDMSEAKRNESELRGYVQRLRHLTNQIRTVEENERRAIARELHDRIGQNLSTLNLMLGMLRQQRPLPAPGVIQEQVVEMQGVLKSTMEHTRSLMSELRPLALEEFGLYAALKDLAGDFARKTQLPVNMRGGDVATRLPFLTEIALYRIAQETLTNIAKHARASSVLLELKETPDIVELSIADNGIGCDFEKLRSSARGWGVITMQERAEAAGIEIDIESAAGHGTHVQLIARRIGI